MSKIYVTGFGIISALGRGEEATLEKLKECESGIENVHFLNTRHTSLPVGEVKYSTNHLNDIAGLTDTSDAGKLRSVSLGLISLRDAIDMARLSAKDLKEALFINGITVGGMDYTEKHFSKILKTDHYNSDYDVLSLNDCGTATEIIAHNIPPVKFATTVSTACSSAANSIALGAEMIHSGMADIALVGGTESLSLFHLNGFNSLMILDDVVCSPFGIEKSGINLGEGAAYLIIENEESVRRRKITPLAILSGYANTCDAYHQTASSENGEGAFLSMTKALEKANLTPEDIDYVNAHGTGTHSNDGSELAAMKRIWGHNVPIFSSTKSLTGHATSAAGGIEAVISIIALNYNLVPSGLPLSNFLDNEFKPLNTPVVNKTISHVLCNSFGFGGNDTSLIFSKVKN